MKFLGKNWLWFVMLAMLASILFVPALNNSFWDFCVSGRVPGTSHVLSPPTVLRGTLAVFALGVLAMLRKKIFRSSKAVPVAQTVVVPVPEPFRLVLPRRAQPRISNASWRWLGIVATIFMQAIAMVATGVEVLVNWLAPRLRWLWQKTEPQLRRFDKWLEVTLHKHKLSADALEIGSEFGKFVALQRRKISSLLAGKQ